MQKGISIVETVAAISIFSIAAIVIGSLFISHTKIYSLENAVGGLKLQKSLFTKYFKETGEASLGIESSRTFSSTNYTSSSSTIIFKLPSLDGTGNLVSGAYDYVVFYSSGNDLFMETDADPAGAKKDTSKKLSDSVENLTFGYDNSAPSSANLVNAYLRLKSGAITEQITASAYLRNK